MKEREAISGIFMNEEGDKVLLLRRNPHRTYSAGKWDLMGGDIKQEETPRETLEKDAKGKLNVDIISVEEREEILIEGIDAFIRRHLFVCKGDYDSLTLDPAKYDQFNWYGEDEIKGLELAPGVEVVLRTIGFLRK